jgi:hypothetical protein
MSKEKNKLNIEDYLKSAEDNTNRNKFNAYKMLMSNVNSGDSNKSMPIANLVQMLILRRLQNKAQEEEVSNQGKRAQLFENYNKQRFEEKKALEKMREEKEIEKEKRQHSRDLEKYKIMELLGQAKEERTHKMRESSDERKRGIETILKSFKDPGDALRYVNNPEKQEENRQVYDANGMIKQGIGKFLDKVNIAEYKPKIRSRLKK